MTHVTPLASGCWPSLPLALVAALLLALPSARADAPHDALSEYRKQALSLDYRFFGGVTLLRGGELEDPGFFGGDADQVFAGSSAALEAMGSYRALKISGTVLLAVGMGLLLSELILLTVDAADLEGLGTDRAVYYGLVGGGAGLSLAGGWLIQGSLTHLSTAVQQYNTDLEASLRRQAAGPQGVQLTLTRRF